MNRPQVAYFLSGEWPTFRAARPDVEAKRQMTVARSGWKGHVTTPNRGRLRHLPLTRRLGEELRTARHLRGPRVLCEQSRQRPEPWRNDGGGGS